MLSIVKYEFVAENISNDKLNVREIPAIANDIIHPIPHGIIGSKKGEGIKY